MTSSVLAAMPHNLEAEQALLGCLLFDSKAFARVEGVVRAIQFYEPFHQRLFAAIEHFFRQDRVAEPITMVDRFKDDQAFKDLGGIRYFADLVDRAPPAANAADYGRVIAELDVRRSLIRLSDGLKGAAADVEPPEKLISWAEWQLREIAMGTSAADAWRDGQVLYDVVSDKLAGKRRPSYVTSGYATLDDGFGGIRRGRLVVLAGRPGMGKSACGLEIARRMARAGLGVGIFSLEMDEEELALRLACGEAFRPDRIGGFGPVYFDVQRDTLRTDDRPLMEAGASALRELPIYFDDRTGLNPGQIVPAAKRLIRTWDKRGVAPGMIMVDHLHLVKPEIDRFGNRAAEIGDVCVALDALAKETGVSVVALCQLNREVENRTTKDKRPQMSDIKGSGSVEEIANTIVFLYRPEYYLVEPEDKSNDKAMTDYLTEKMKWENKIQFLVRKNRGGINMKDYTMRISLPHNAMWEDDQP